MNISKAKEQIAVASAYIETLPIYYDKLKNKLSKCLDTAYKSLSE